MNRGENQADVKQIKYVQRNTKILLSLIAFNAVVWLLLPFGIILPIIGSIWVQLVWSGLFVVYLAFFFIQRSTIITNILLIIFTFFISFIFILINLVGAVYWYYPEYKGKCHGQYIYSKVAIPTLHPQPPSDYFNSYLPFLYLQKVQPNDRFYVLLGSPYFKKVEGGLGDVLVCIENQTEKVIPANLTLEEYKRNR
jgi:hypothetical protein